MIAMVKGTLMEKSEGEAVVMTVGGLGLRVMCSMNTLAVLPAAGQEYFGADVCRKACGDPVRDAI